MNPNSTTSTSNDVIDIHHCLRKIAEDIAHELRTPLATIMLGISGVKDNLDDLITTYYVAQAQQLSIPEILPQGLTALRLVLNNCLQEAEVAMKYINMLAHSLLNNAAHGSVSLLSLKKCLSQAFTNYPYQNTLHKINFNPNLACEDFLIQANEATMVQVFYNVIKTMLTSILTSKMASIAITTERDQNVNNVIINYSCDYISAANQAHLMNLFKFDISDIAQGIYFCKQVMQALAGNIYLKTLTDRHVTLILTFPCISTE